MIPGDVGESEAVKTLGLQLLSEVERRPGNIPKPLLPVVSEALGIMRNERLLEPVTVSRVWPVREVDNSGVVLNEGTRFLLDSADELMAGTRSLVVGICGIGTNVELRISELFHSKHFRLALAMDGFANRALFRLSDQLLKKLRREARSFGMRLGQPFEPGNTGFPLGCQNDLVRLAGGAEAGFSVTGTGMVRPGRALDFIAAMGDGLPIWHASKRCDNCPSGTHCFNRVTPVNRTSPNA
ncbi:MAG: hypothetical protein HKL84_05500 [Acidimicrobiaceae bacterium]|nr:hypothetical protein [Acidimicrobiaceae bacterium]